MIYMSLFVKLKKKKPHKNYVREKSGGLSRKFQIVF